MTRRLALLGALASLAAGGLARAQIVDSTPIILRLSSSARALGQGDAWVAGNSDDAIFYNPAQLNSVRGTSMQLERFAPGNLLETLSSAAATSKGGMGIAVSVLRFGTAGAIAGPGAAPLTVASLTNRPSGSTNGEAIETAFGFAQPFFGTRFGVLGKYVSERVGSASADGVMADVGASRGFSNVTAGISLQNLGRQEFSPARQIRAGVNSISFPVGPFDLAGSAAVLVRRHWLGGGGGGELSYSWIDGNSVGFRAGAERPETPGAKPWTGGLTMTSDRISFDYAVEWLSAATATHRFEFRFR